MICEFTDLSDFWKSIRKPEQNPPYQPDITFFDFVLELRSCFERIFDHKRRDLDARTFDMRSPLCSFFFFLKHSFTLGVFSGFHQVRLCHCCTSAPFQVFTTSTALFLAIAYVFTHGALAGFHRALQSMLFISIFECEALLWEEADVVFQSSEYWLVLRFDVSY